MKPYNLYLCGVGGQGIGLLAELLGQACLAAGHPVKGSDTHGLAQRGGTVVSHLKLGHPLFTPRIPPGEADLVVGLERLEALRGLVTMLRPGGAVVWYDAVYQPLVVRQGLAVYPTEEELIRAAAARQATPECVRLPDLPDPRMQNVALLGRIAARGFIPGVTPELLETILRAQLPARVLEQNLAVFRAGGGGGECTGAAAARPE